MYIIPTDSEVNDFLLGGTYYVEDLQGNIRACR